jgi:DNA-binding CsgD family transcriptional regulator
MIVLGLALYMIALWYMRTDKRREKKQAAVMFISALITCVINITMQTVMPVLGVNTLHVPQLFILIWIAGISFAMLKYRFMSAPEITGDEILSNIEDMVLIVSPELRIISANRSFKTALTGVSNGFSGMDLFSVLLKDRDSESNIKAILEGGTDRVKCRLHYINGREPVITDSYISGITDRFSDFIGLLIISRRNRGWQHLRIAYNITQRESEILALCLDGLSNRETGEKLGISERTVERHVNNIYNKMNIGNRIELLKTAYEFDLMHKENSSE